MLLCHTNNHSLSCTHAQLAVSTGQEVICQGLDHCFLVTPGSTGGCGGRRGGGESLACCDELEDSTFSLAVHSKASQLDTNCAALRNFLMGFRIAKSGMCSWKPPARHSLSRRHSRATICYQVLKSGDVLRNPPNKTKSVFLNRWTLLCFPQYPACISLCCSWFWISARTPDSSVHQ